MRLSDDAADIPDRLLALQEKGEAVFLCGAGISQRYGLPSFHQLTTRIYHDLGETWLGHPAEEDAMGLDQDGQPKGQAALDRALFALSTRLRGHDTASRVRAETLLTDAIEGNLKAPAGPFHAHEDIWSLSRDAEMRRRVVTTNFDTLFERSGAKGAASRACADLPPPLSTDFAGVLHLHGRIADGDLGLPRTALVFNSAEFGEAYLRSGWAARYVYDLARASTIVILGYGADDPPMRYILEVLTADRERYSDIREIFAFVPSKTDARSIERSSAIWGAKGATAIPYQSDGPADHDALYRTLANWARFANDPTGWRRTEAGRILHQDPDAVSEGDWERLRWLLAGGDAGDLLGEINPEPIWAAPLSKAQIFNDSAVSPSRWIIARLSDPRMPAAFAENLPLAPETLGTIERSIDWNDRSATAVSPIVIKAWRIIVRVGTARLGRDRDVGYSWFKAKHLIGEGDFSLATRRELISCLRPRMQIGRVFRWPGLDDDPAPGSLQLRQVLRVDWGPGPLDKISELVCRWPAEDRETLIRCLAREVEDALEDAADTDTLLAASSDVRSISRHSQDQYPDGFYSIVRAIIDLWDAESIVRPERAKATAAGWLASRYLLQRRMGLHALLQPCFTGVEVVSHLLDLSDQDFWLSDARRETMQLFVLRWPTVGKKDRAKVEQRILAGMPRELLVSDGDEKQIAAVRENAVFMRLARLEGAGIELSGPAAAALRTLRKKHPAWISNGEEDDFRVWSSGVRTVGRQGEVSLLSNTPPEKVLGRVEEIVGRDPFAQGDLWRLYCDAEPQRALAALLTDDPTSARSGGAWQSYFWAIAATDRSDIQSLTLEAVSDPDFKFEPYVAITEWLLRKRPTLALPTSGILALWDRLFAVIEAKSAPIQDQSRRDVVFSMLNSAEGKIGTILLNEYGRARDHGGRQDQLEILGRLERLVSADGEAGFLGTAAAMDGLQALFSEHEAWATKHLLPLTIWSSPFAPAAWAVLLGGDIPRPPLYAALRCGLLEAGTHSELDRCIQAVGQWLVAPLLWAQAPDGPVPEIDGPDVRRALARSTEEVRSSAAHWLGEAIENLNGATGDLWRSRIGPLFKIVWPIDPACRSPAATLHLLRLALRTGDAFPEAAGSIAPALGPLDAWEVESYLGPESDARELLEKHPGAMLTLLHATVAEDRVPRSLLSILLKLLTAAPTLETDPRFMKLMGWARRQAAQ